jgi:S-adenosylmethionine:tRNA ribosyltransferase-isomerase
MKLSNFRFNLPQELIASRPSENRGEARMMVLNRKTKTIEHKKFADILDYFDDGDVMIQNNSKVFPARMYGNKEKTGAVIEVFLLRELNAESRLWDAIVEPARKIRIGNKLYFGNDDLVAEVIDNTTSRGRTIRFLFDGTYEQFRDTLERMGETPIPKYLNRKVEPWDEERFQTVYATNEGSVSVPASGSHFDKIMLKKLEIKGVKFAPVTLHIGLGCFRDVEVEDLTKHKLDSEEIFISEKAAEIVNEAKEHSKRICCVGTSTLRAIESSVSSFNTLKPFSGWTNKFIFPPYDFAIPNSLLVNFQAPESVLLMKVAAFGGYEFVMEAYREAIKEKYNFLAYGDVMLII